MEPDLEKLAEDLRAVCEAANTRPPPFLAVNESGWLGIAAAATMPESFSRLILFRCSLVGARTDDMPWEYSRERIESNVNSIQRATNLNEWVRVFIRDTGRDGYPWVGEWEAVVEQVELFLTGTHTEPEPERVLATVLFTDIVDSSSRAAELGGRHWHELLERHHATIRRLLALHQGRELDTAGDGFFATFEVPARAIRCGRRSFATSSASACGSEWGSTRVNAR